MSSGAVGAATEVKAEKEAEIVCCANCGIAQVDDDIKLEDCDACQSVSYCSDKCHENHRDSMRKSAKNERRNCVTKNYSPSPMSPILGSARSASCRCHLILENLCLGRDVLQRNHLLRCIVANHKSNKHDPIKARRCPFCREVADDKNAKRLNMKRVEAGDAAALTLMGGECYEGAFEYLTKAAELGDSSAHYNLSSMYREGLGVEKDEEKEVYHLEKAAIDGHPAARNNLAYCEERNVMQLQKSLSQTIKCGHSTKAYFDVLSWTMNLEFSERERTTYLFKRGLPGKMRCHSLRKEFVQ